MTNRARFLERLSYNPDTGELTWRHCVGMPRQWNTRLGGTIAGCVLTNGYRLVCVDGKRYMAHRVIWMMQTGAWPERTIDHIDGNKDNNSWVNLRAATDSQNQHNRPKPRSNTSGYKGVSWHRNNHKWRASIMVNNKAVWLGSFDTPELAAEAYSKAAERLHGEFARFA